MQTRFKTPQDNPTLIFLIAQFRTALAQLRGKETTPDLEAAKEELNEYLQKENPIFVAEMNGDLLGYLVCRVDGDVVWVESLYVKPAFRRQGIASSLYAKAEQLALQLGGDAPYNWVDPNNTPIISFLAKRGYNVLNLLELRRPYPDETLTHTIKVGPYTFNCR